MFENEYRETFSQVTASEETYRRILNMTNKAKPRKGGRALMKIVLIAAIVSLLAVTASASESVAGWFRNYFAGSSEEGMTAEQGMYIEENEQVIDEAQTQDNCTIELKSFLTDGQVALMTFRVSAPEGMKITDAQIGNWGYGILESLDGRTIGTGLIMYQVDDNDDKDNTMDLLFELDAEVEGISLPFMKGARWKLHVEDLVAVCENKEYLSQFTVIDGGFTLNAEETKLAYPEYTLVDGVWDYELTVSEGDFREIELLDSPITTTWQYGRRLLDNGEYEAIYKEYTLNSVILRSMSLTIYTESENVSFGYDKCFAVMKDGSQIGLVHTYSRNGGHILRAEYPIVLEKVDYILLADGTKLPVPELSE